MELFEEVEKKKKDIGGRIQNLRLREGIGSQVKLAQAMSDYITNNGLKIKQPSTTTVWKWEKGDTTPSEILLAVLCKVLKCTEGEVLLGESADMDIRPLTINNGMKIPVFKLDDLQEALTKGKDTDEFIYVADNYSPESFGFVMVGNSMVSENSKESIPPESVVVIDPSEQCKTDDVVLVKVKDANQFVVRKLQDDVGRCFFVSFNPMYLPFEKSDNTEIVGKVRQITVGF